MEENSFLDFLAILLRIRILVGDGRDVVVMPCSNKSETGVAVSIVKLMRGAATNSAVDLVFCNEKELVDWAETEFRMLVVGVVTKDATSNATRDIISAAVSMEVRMDDIDVIVVVLIGISILISGSLLGRRRRTRWM